MEPADPRSDEALVLAIAAGDTTATQSFKTRRATVLQKICGSVTPDDRSGAEAYRDLMASGDLTALFAGFDGRSSWKTFVLAAVVNRFLFPRLLRRLGGDPVRHAAEFEAFFRRDVMRAVRAAIPRRDLDEDASQWIWEQLLDKNSEQLRKFAEQARTPGFVVVKLKRLAQDFLNSKAAPAEGRKRTLPETLTGLPSFDQDVYKQFYWWRAASARVAVLAMRHRHPEATEAAVITARVRVEALLRAGGGLFVVDRAPQSIDAEPILNLPNERQPIVFEEVERAAFRRALLAAALGLTSREKLCLLKRLQDKSATQIAADLRISREDAYALMRGVMDKLRKTLVSNPAARERIATITGNESYVGIGATSSGGRQAAARDTLKGQTDDTR